MGARVRGQGLAGSSQGSVVGFQRAKGVARQCGVGVFTSPARAAPASRSVSARGQRPAVPCARTDAVRHSPARGAWAAGVCGGPDAAGCTQAASVRPGSASRCITYTSAGRPRQGPCPASSCSRFRCSSALGLRAEFGPVTADRRARPYSSNACRSAKTCSAR